MGRSKSYPGLSLEDCVKIITAAAKSGESLSDEELAGFTVRERANRQTTNSAKSGAFTRRKAALRAFGLIEGGSGINKITQLSKSIIAPQEENQRPEALKAAFLHPDIFREIFNQLAKDQDLDVERNIANKSMSHGIKTPSKDRFGKVFVESGIYAGLISESGENTVKIPSQSPQPTVESSQEVESATHQAMTSTSSQKLQASSQDSVRIQEDSFLVKIEGPNNFSFSFEMKDENDVDTVSAMLKQFINLL